MLIKLAILLVGILTTIGGLAAASQLNWVAIPLLLYSALMWYAWWNFPGKTTTARWPTGLPRLYPKQDGVPLCHFLTDEQYEAIQQFPIVTLLPFSSFERGEKLDALFGAGVALVLNRDLMLVRNLSVRGPEDTPRAGFDDAPGLAEGENRVIYVTGLAQMRDEGYAAQLVVFKPGEPPFYGEVVESELSAFLYESAAWIAAGVGGHVDAETADRWKVARPSTAESLIRLGWLFLRSGADDQECTEQAIGLLEADPAFAVPACLIDSDDARALPYLLQGLERDPYFAQLCFSLFCTVWQSTGWEPAAMQFARRAIELSPGHGKAHMCAPHAAHPDAKMLRHSELGYRLLPGNPFAVNNYVLNLCRAGAPVETVLELAKEGIASDPHDPGNYERLIELFCETRQYGAALTVAEHLQRLYEPEMDERALYCLKQNPAMAQQIESGQYDPVLENRRRIDALQQKVDAP